MKECLINFLKVNLLFWGIGKAMFRLFICRYSFPPEGLNLSRDDGIDH